jgi:hypothetical protein
VDRTTRQAHVLDGLPRVIATVIPSPRPRIANVSCCGSFALTTESPALKPRWAAAKSFHDRCKTLDALAMRRSDQVELVAMINEALGDPSSTSKHTTTTPNSVAEREQAIAALEARLTPVERLEYYESIAQGELRFDALSAILRTR